MFKVYVTKPDGSRLNIFVNSEGNFDPPADHLIVDSVENLNIVVKSLQANIDEHTVAGEGVLANCTLHVQPL